MGVSGSARVYEKEKRVVRRKRGEGGLYDGFCLWEIGGGLSGFSICLGRGRGFGRLLGFLLSFSASWVAVCLLRGCSAYGSWYTQIATFVF